MRCWRGTGSACLSKRGSDRVTCGALCQRPGPSGPVQTRGAGYLSLRSVAARARGSVLGPGASPQTRGWPGRPQDRRSGASRPPSPAARRGGAAACAQLRAASGARLWLPAEARGRCSPSAGSPAEPISAHFPRPRPRASPAASPPPFALGRAAPRSAVRSCPAEGPRCTPGALRAREAAEPLRLPAGHGAVPSSPPHQFPALLSEP